MNITSLFSQHIDYLTSDFNKKNPSNPGFKKTSALVGYTALFYLVPIFFIKDSNKWTSIYKILWGVQTLFVFMADYWIPKMQLQTTGHNDESIIYGIDRLMATTMVLSMIIITYLYLDKIYLIGAIPPIYFVSQSKAASANYEWDKMVINQTMWHITGPLIAAYVLYKIQLKNKLFT